MNLNKYDDMSVELIRSKTLSNNSDKTNIRLLITLATSLLCGFNLIELHYSNTITGENIQEFNRLITEKNGKVTANDFEELKSNELKNLISNQINKYSDKNNCIIIPDDGVDLVARVYLETKNLIEKFPKVFSNGKELDEIGRSYVESLIDLHNDHEVEAHNNESQGLINEECSKVLCGYEYTEAENLVFNIKTAILHEAYAQSGNLEEYNKLVRQHYTPYDALSRRKTYNVTYPYKYALSIECLVENSKKQLKEELKKLRDNIQSSQEEKDLLSQKLKQKVEKIHELESELTQIKNENSIKNEALEKLELNISELGSERDAMQSKIEKLKAENEHLENILRQLEDNPSELINRIINKPEIIDILINKPEFCNRLVNKPEDTNIKDRPNNEQEDNVATTVPKPPAAEGSVDVLNDSASSEKEGDDTAATDQKVVEEDGADNNVNNKKPKPMPPAPSQPLTKDNFSTPHLIFHNTQASVDTQIHAVRNITSILSSTMSQITTNRMPTNTFVDATDRGASKSVAAGSEINELIKPTSWDIWASGHMGGIDQDATSNGTKINAKTGFYGVSGGIDKVFGNNHVLGLALSYGQSDTEYSSAKDKKSGDTGTNKKLESDYYQSNLYGHFNCTDNLFLQFMVGVGTYGKDAKITNIFDWDSQEFTSGYHGSATIGYSIFGGESSFSITPKLGISYYHLNIPDSILAQNKSSTFTKLDKVDGTIGATIKMLGLGNNLESNIAITPEFTAAFKLNLYNEVGGANADKIKLPAVKSDSDQSADALASPEYLFTLGGALNISGTNVSFGVHVSIDLAVDKKYFAYVGGINLKLSF